MKRKNYFTEQTSASKFIKAEKHDFLKSNRNKLLQKLALKRGKS